jgi:hypothetical protein
MSFLGPLLTKSGTCLMSLFRVQPERLEMMDAWFPLKSGVYLASFNQPDNENKWNSGGSDAAPQTVRRVFFCNDMPGIDSLYA